MYKIFVRSILYSGVLKQNLILSVNAFLVQHTRSYSKAKKAKKMFRDWEFTSEANEYQMELQKEKQQQQKTTCQKQKSPPTSNYPRQYRLVSYNILAQDLLTEHLYLYYGIDSQYLRWEHRLRCLKNELTYLNADILCIQEMQFNHLKEFVGILSENRKMEYIYKKKTGHRTDGCAIIYDRDLFQLLAQQDLELHQPNIDSKLNRENVAIFAKFKLRHEPHKQIVIGTTHLLYNPRRHDVRVAQAELILKKLRNFSLKCDNDHKNPYLPVILTGDMNSEPKSPPFNRLTSKLDEQKVIKIDDNNRGESEEENCDPESEEGIVETVAPFALKAINFGRNCASTHHDRWITVDYILRSIRNENYDDNEQADGAQTTKSDVKVLSFYKLPSLNNCERAGKIPNQVLGSDHYLQAIEFLVV